MKHIKIPFEQTGSFSKMFLDYISGEEALKPFYACSPQLENFEQQIRCKEKQFTSEQRQILADTLTQQYHHISTPPTSQIELLREGNTFTVTTGHQLNIFTGPLYFLYKIVAVINLTKKLKATYPDYNFVPVYWMATEDHDFEEISFFNAFGNKYQWEHPSPSGAVGRLNLDGIEQILNRIQDMPAFFKEAYTQHENLTDATRYFVHHLFGEEGLICVDADHAQLKQSLKPAIKKDIKDNLPYQLVTQTDETLEVAGYKSQIFVRPINFFYMEGNIRERIEKIGNEYVIVDTDLRFSEREMDQLIEEHPERFSPNVVLRPFYQEVILPNLAYLGGPAEVIYWLQLKSEFDEMGVPFPILMPRSFALLLSEKEESKLNRFGFDVEDIFKSEHDLKNEFIQKHSEKDYELKEEAALLDTLYAQIMEKAKAVDPALETHVKAEQHRVSKRFEHTINKLRKSEQRNLLEGIEQILKVKQAAFPAGAPQERKDNMLNFYIKDKELIQKLLDSFDPLDYSFNILID
ncbi:bacillithiol biosynthesis cysteine-adding enzyme BshC [Limibacter armeniacum]|uniref:bacillithiol biosynthesis cysteine-adding enzyme BshC n=1 Tax=Limibacter armeniacum TaxID=466084 RepID=UPI002FE6735C